MGPLFTEPHLVDELLSINGVSSCDLNIKAFDHELLFEDGTKLALPHGPKGGRCLHKDLVKTRTKCFDF